MSRSRSAFVVASAALAAFAASGACGRLDFNGVTRSDPDAPTIETTTPDAAPDAAVPADFESKCAVLLHMDEDQWIDHSGSGSGSGSGTDVGNECFPSNPGLSSGLANPVDDPVRGRVGQFTAGSCINMGARSELDATTGVTTSAWVLMTGDPVDSFGIVSKRVDFSVGGEYSMYIWSGSRIWADIDTENDRFGGHAAIPSNVWTQITMVYDAARPASERTRLFVNGQLDAVGQETSDTITQFNSPLSIGCLPLGGPAQTFIGSLDDVGVWTRAFSDSDVAAWYALTKR